jgi:hypothetical protein
MVDVVRRDLEDLLNTRQSHQALPEAFVETHRSILGVIYLDTQDRSKTFTQEDLKLFWGVANQAAIAMENACLHDESVAKARLESDLHFAKGNKGKSGYGLLGLAGLTGSAGAVG